MQQVAIPRVPASEEIIDAAMLAELCRMVDDGSPVAGQSLLHMFRADVEPHLRAMREAVAAADAPKLRRAAHGIKGAAANLGAKPLAAFAPS